MKNIRISRCIAAALLLGLAACSNSGNDAPAPTPPPPPPPPQATDFTGFVKSQFPATADDTDPVEVDDQDFAFADQDDPAAFDDLLAGP